MGNLAFVGCAARQHRTSNSAHLGSLQQSELATPPQLALSCWACGISVAHTHPHIPESYHASN
eukprot:5496292-Amphidinium_carterae.2